LNSLIQFLEVLLGNFAQLRRDPLLLQVRLGDALTRANGILHLYLCFPFRRGPLLKEAADEGPLRLCAPQLFRITAGLSGSEFRRSTTPGSLAAGPETDAETRGLARGALGL